MQIAPFHLNPADKYFSVLTLRNRLHGLIEQINLNAIHRRSNGRSPGCVSVAGYVVAGTIDRRLGGPVAVNQMQLRNGAGDIHQQPFGNRLHPRQQPPQPAAAGLVLHPALQLGNHHRGNIGGRDFLSIQPV